MFKTTLAVAALATTLVAGAASAQSYYPPMDMSWALQSQQNNYNMGNYMAQMYGWQAYQYLAAQRAAGHPFNGVLTLGNNPNTYTADNYLRNSNAQYNAVRDNTIRSVQGCWRYYNGQYVRAYAC